MSEKTIVMYEVSQKQRFIFRTNRLLENIGASHIIRELTTDPKKLFNNRVFQEQTNKTVQLPEPTYRIVGGGNATFIFDHKEDASNFARNLSATVLEHLPGIELFLVTKTVDWDKDLLYNASERKGIMDVMRSELANKKNKRKHAVRQLSWGIQKMCASSGMPANVMVKNDLEGTIEPRSQEFELIKALGRDIRNDGYYDRFIKNNQYLPDPHTYELLKEDHLQTIFNENSSSEIKRYLSIISIDGNAMGVKVGKFFKNDFRGNENFIHDYEAFTKKIDDVYTNAFRRTIGRVMERYDVWAEEYYGEEKDKEKWKKVVPIRPIIASGDDVSFITYGKLGIEIAKTFLRYLQEDKETGYSFEACAGVAIVRHKYPFWLGIEIAEQLCTNAKKRLKEDREKWLGLGMGTPEEPYDTSLIDWQLINHSDTVQNIAEYRKQYFENEDGSKLIMRPYYIQKESDKDKHFANYEAAFKRVAIHALQRSKANEKNSDNEQDNHLPSMSKWKTLRDVYHEGVLAVKQWQVLNQFSPSGDLSVDDELFYSYKDGFGTLKDAHDKDGQYVAKYYDAIEIFDYFIDLG